MRYIILFEAYNDLIGQGIYNKVSEIDNDWVLKTPKSPDERGESYLLTSDVYEEFDSHIRIMQKHPQLFPKAKKLSKGRAAIERLNTEEAILQMDHVCKAMIKARPLYTGIENLKKFFFHKDWIIGEIFESDALLEMLGSIDDPICKKWFNFITLTKIELKDYTAENELYANSGNFGIDKQGNIKLLDF